MCRGPRLPTAAAAKRGIGSGIGADGTVCVARAARHSGNQPYTHVWVPNCKLCMVSGRAPQELPGGGIFSPRLSTRADLVSCACSSLTMCTVCVGNAKALPACWTISMN